MSDDRNMDDSPTNMAVQLAVLKTELAAVKADVRTIKGAIFFVIGAIVSGFLLALIAMLVRTAP